MNGNGNGNGSRGAIDEYRQTNLSPQIGEANPHELVQMMLDGAVARVAQAQGALEAGDVPLKCEYIGKVIGLVEGLRVSLDLELGGELAENLQSLYEYIVRRLLRANLSGDPEILVEVMSLLRELQGGWREMGLLIAQHDATVAEQASLAVP